MLTTRQRHDLHRALLGAFDATEFGGLIRERIGAPLERLVRPGPMAGQVYEVIQAAERAGWTDDLVRAAYEARPRDQAVVDVYQTLGLATEVTVQHSGAPDADLGQAEAKGFEQVLSQQPAFVDIGLWRERLTMIEAQVCRVEFDGSALATGFLVGPDAVLTCSHGIADIIEGKKPHSAVRFRFDYRIALGAVNEGLIVELHPAEWLIDWSPYAPCDIFPDPSDELPTPDQLDHALLRLARPIGSEPFDPSTVTGPVRGWIQVPDHDPPIVPQMPLVIVQHAKGGPLKIAFDNDSMIGLNPNGTRMRYATQTEVGSAGSPCFDATWQLVGMHHSAERGLPITSRMGEGIPIAAIRDRLKRVGKAAALGGTRPKAATYPPGIGMDPPEPKPVLEEDDPQKGRWGGMAARDGRRVSVRLNDVGRMTFDFDVLVTSTDGSILEPPVVFHLHDSYSPDVFRINTTGDDGSVKLEGVSSYGVYTIGVQVRTAKGKWTGLEYDLSSLEDLPARFLSR